MHYSVNEMAVRIVEEKILPHHAPGSIPYCKGGVFRKREYRLEIDLKPALEEGTLDKRLLSDFEKHANSDFCNALNDLLPQKLIPVLVERTGIPEHQKVHDITREQRRELLRLLKHFPVEVAGLRPVTDALITSGGVKVSEK